MTLDSPDRPGDDLPMTELRELVLRHHDSGMSYEDMARRARRQGHQVDKQYFQMVATGKIRLPGKAKLAAIAAAIPGLSEKTVKEAAARSVDIHVERDVSYRLARVLDVIDDLSATGRDRWFRLAAAIARELAQEETGVAPRTVIGHEGDRPDAMTERIVGRELDRMEAEEQAKDQRRKRGPH